MFGLKNIALSKRCRWRIDLRGWGHGERLTKEYKSGCHRPIATPLD